MILSLSGLMDRFHFTPAQRSRYFQALRAGQEDTLDFTASALVQNLDPNDPGLREQTAKLRDQLIASEQSILGDEFSAWQEALGTLNARALVRQLMQSTFQSDGAFTPVQADELTQVVAHHQLGKSRTDWRGVLADAKGVLTEQQMDSLTLAVTGLETGDEMTAIKEGRSGGKL